MRSRAPRPWQVAGPQRSRGVAAVEFAIAAPLLLFTMLATAEVGRAFVHYHTLSLAVRDSARYVSEHAIEGTTGVVELSDETIARARNLAVYANPGGAGDPVLPDFEADDVTVVDAGGDNIRVTAVYPYRPMIGAVLPAFGGQGDDVALDFAMQIVVTMRAIS